MLLGIDIGGTFIKYCITDTIDENIEVKKLVTNQINDRTDILRSIDRIIKSNDSISSAGIGFPGIINNHGIVKISPNLNGWDNFDFKSYLRNNYSVPSYIDNDANVAAIAELTEGNGRDFENFIYVTLGTGIGGAIIINKKIFGGDIGSAGEIGHVIINTNDKINEKMRNYRVGILEEYAGRMQILGSAKQILINHPDSDLNKLPNFDVSDISEFAEKADAAAMEIFDSTASYIGAGLVSAMNLLDIHTVIIGGGISKSNYLINKIKEFVKLRALPHIAEDFRLLNAKYQSETGIIGALLAAKYFSKL